MWIDERQLKKQRQKEYQHLTLKKALIDRELDVIRSEKELREIHLALRHLLIGCYKVERDIESLKDECAQLQEKLDRRV